LFRLPNLDTLILTTDFREKWGSRRVRPVNRGCLLPLGTWTHLWYIQRFLFALFSDLYFLQDFSD
jgi:hypothetical protein